MRQFLRKKKNSCLDFLHEELEMYPENDGSYRPTTPFHVFIVLASSIFIAESLIMFFLTVIPPLSPITTMFMDSFLLLVIVSPVLYYFLLLPLIVANKKARAGNTAKRQFLATMSHEIRTPLNSVIGFSNLLKSTSLNIIQEDYIDTICDSGEALLELINDILDMSKIEAEELRLENIDFDLQYLAESVIKIVKPRLKYSEIELFLDCEEGIAETAFNGDPTRIRQIIMNLLANAIKFTERGEVGVTIKFEKKGDEKNTTTENSLRTILISVKDTGIGIPKDKQDVVFEAFTQANMSTTREFGGTGLGLQIVKTLITAMGGEIELISEEGKGTEFIVTLNLKESVPLVKKNITPVQIEQLKGKTFLIIDDNKNSLRILEMHCKKFFLNVVHKFSSAETALDWLLNTSDIPDIILSDTDLPGMNGFELAQMIRKEKKFSAIKLIAVTGRALPGDAFKSKEFGFDAYLAKPIVRKDLFRIIQLTLGDNRKGGQIITKHMGEELCCKGIKVLVAEDNPVNQKLVNIILKKFGCVVDLVSDGKEAVQKVRENSYDLCLIDLHMPVMDGIEATLQIRNNTKNKELPIIALTAAATKEDKEKCLSSGMNDYILKPINRKSLKEKIILWGTCREGTSPAV